MPLPISRDPSWRFIESVRRRKVRDTGAVVTVATGVAVLAGQRTAVAFFGPFGVAPRQVGYSTAEFVTSAALLVLACGGFAAAAAAMHLTVMMVWGDRRGRQVVALLVGLPLSVAAVGGLLSLASLDWKLFVTINLSSGIAVGLVVALQFEAPQPHRRVQSRQRRVRLKSRRLPGPARGWVQKKYRFVLQSLNRSAEFKSPHPDVQSPPPEGSSQEFWNDPGLQDGVQRTVVFSLLIVAMLVGVISGTLFYLLTGSGVGPTDAKAGLDAVPTVMTPNTRLEPVTLLPMGDAASIPGYAPGECGLLLGQSDGTIVLWMPDLDTDIPLDGRTTFVPVAEAVVTTGCDYQP